MSLAPLITAGPLIFAHASLAILAFILGLFQFALKKGTTPHRAVGWVWVSLLAFVALSSFWIHDIRMWGPFSPIHLLSIFTLVNLPLAVYFARKGNIKQHRIVVMSLFIGALVVAGGFSLFPGRVMYQVVFGG